MELTWLAIIASLCMGIGAVLVFVYAVKRNYFSNLEDAKYQVFWSDVEDLVESPQAEQKEENEDDESPGETRA
jgi:hypothetical protein